ncbi:PREDICTED: uncharacterized protein LOC109470076 [Branchiostoma belcheri]|uniref:Uncharacterized protein LOC109470076 n=1 Tax=Branchiostoma belcheri TaxID=7741 RepID=A0A6P4YJ07_BRABE|nr:PREDICTED: uncharacterized protein LOC109470076 [Branchiostoma belcheri]
MNQAEVADMLEDSLQILTGSAQDVIERENSKRALLTATSAAAALAHLSAVVGIVGFAMDQIGSVSAKTTAQLDEVQDKLRTLDNKIDDFTRKVSDLKLGQQYLRQVILYGRDEQRLRNVLDTLARMKFSNGQYKGIDDIQGWADSVLSHGSDGINSVLFNLLEMVKPRSSIFGGKSLFEIYHQQLKGHLEQYSIKMRLKAAQIYGLIGSGYRAWIRALLIKGRDGDILTTVQAGKSKLKDVCQSMKKYVDYEKVL